MLSCGKRMQVSTMSWERKREVQLSRMEWILEPFLKLLITP